MEINKYYFSNADSIYGLMRKTLIYVTKINKKTFNYKIADWKANHELKDVRLEVYIHYDSNRLGKLIDSDCFDLFNDSNLLDKVVKK